MKGYQIGLIVILGVILVSSSYVYIYHSNYYRSTHSINLEDGSGVEGCTKTTSCLFYTCFLCKFGYYQVTYPTHKRIFYYSYSTSEAGHSINTLFLEGADIDTFKVLNKNYAIDKNTLYSFKYGYDGIIEVSDANLDSVSIFSDADKYAKDNASVFFWGEKLSGVNPADFKFIDNGQSKFGLRFALSNGKIFHGNKVVSAVRDGKILVKTQTQDKEIPFPCKNLQKSSSGIHSCDIADSGKDTKVDIDIDSFQVISNEAYPYVKDKNYVYMCAMIGCSELHVIEGANPETFNFGKVRDYEEDRNIHDGYIQGCKVYEGVKSNYVGSIERSSDYSNLCKYVLY